MIEAPGNTTFVRSVVVSGSLEGPDSGYQELAAFELETHGPDEEVTELTPEVQAPVRWIKIRFDGGINIEEGDEGKTNIWFSELIGNGTQESRELSTAFDGLWIFRSPERTDYGGQPLELHQSGATIVGHTSTEGSVEHNLDLSERRAQAVVDDLIERGFDAANLSARGEGESQPLVKPDKTETAREINRRVEVTCAGV